MRTRSLTPMIRFFQGQVSGITRIHLPQNLTSANRGNKILDSVFVDMPPYERITTGMWIDVSKPALELMSKIGISLAAAIHSAQHAFINRFALSSDLRTECKAEEKEKMKVPTTRMRPAR